MQALSLSLIPGAAGEYVPFTCTLARRQLLVEAEPLGRRIACYAGCLWLTFDRDSADYVLEAGQSLVCAKSGRLIVQALSDARVGLA